MKSSYSNENKKWLLTLLTKIGISEVILKKEVPELYETICTDTQSISIEDLSRLLNTLENITNDPHIGLTLAQDTRLDNIGLYGYLLGQSRDLGELLQAAIKYYPIYHRPAKLSLKQKRFYSTFSYSDVIPTKNSCRHDNEWCLGWFVNQISSKTSFSWKPKKVCFSNPEPKDVSKLVNIFGENLFFEQPSNSFDIENKLLLLPYSDVDSSVLAVIKPIADKLVDEIVQEQCLESKVRILIMKNLMEEDFSCVFLAKELFMSLSSLKRKLSKIGLSYSAIRDDVILYLAKELLSETTLSINQIAMSLGYSEHSAFNHAFLRLSQYSPRQYRELSSERNL